jgi:hypothetical protein
LSTRPAATRKLRHDAT